MTIDEMNREAIDTVMHRETTDEQTSPPRIFTLHMLVWQATKFAVFHVSVTDLCDGGTDRRTN